MKIKSFYYSLIAIAVVDTTSGEPCNKGDSNSIWGPHLDGGMCDQCALTGTLTGVGPTSASGSCCNFIYGNSYGKDSVESGSCLKIGEPCVIEGAGDVPGPCIPGLICSPTVFIPAEDISLSRMTSTFYNGQCSFVYSNGVVQTTLIGSSNNIEGVESNPPQLWATISCFLGIAMMATLMTKKVAKEYRNRYQNQNQYNEIVEKEVDYEI